MKNLLLLGDSIRVDYDSFVREKLTGRMNVYFSEDNGRFAQYTLRLLSDWKGKLELPEIHVVHWNNGLWDLLHMDVNYFGDDGEAAGKTIKAANNQQTYTYDQEPLTPPHIYRYMLGRVATRIHQLFPMATIIFATTTPVIEEESGCLYRSNAEIQQYNQIAREELIPRGVLINELGDFAIRECSNLHRDWTHFNEAGSAKFADEIVRFLEKNNLI